MKDLCRTVAEDIEYVAGEFGPSITTAALRRGSNVLRRLLVYDDFLKARKAAGIPGKPVVEAPRGEVFLEIPGHSKVAVVVAGGGEYAGIEAALAVINAGGHPIPLPPGVNPLGHVFGLGEFLNSIGIYVEGLRIRRRDIISYVANKLGGTHLDTRRSGKIKNKFEALDRNADRLQIGDVPSVNGKNAVYFELLSIGQLFAKSAAAKDYLEWYRQAV